MMVMRYCCALVLLFASTCLPAEESGWTYDGPNGPEYWAELDEAYDMCGKGVNQSPVDLVGDANVDLPKLVFDYQGHSVQETNNGHTIQMDVSGQSFLRVPERNRDWMVKQFHFHSPSEHTVAGRHSAMEIHIVHVGEDGALLVLGILVEEGAEHELLNELWSFMPEQTGESIQVPVPINETDLLPPTDEYFFYSGSLTTPPCDEGVRWLVLKQSIEASVEQIDRFKSRVGQLTNRPVQGHHARWILE